MNRFTVEMGDSLDFTFWLIFDRDGAVRLVRSQPDGLGRSERAMAATISLPKSLWQTPSLSVTITVPPDSAPAEFNISAEAAANALKQALGADVHVVVHPHEPN